MRRNVLLSAAAAVVLLGPCARADEPPLLERLNAETTRVANAAHRAVVTVSGGPVMGIGVIVGTPPRIVVPFAVAGDKAVLKITLSDGSVGTASRLDASAELGIAAYAPGDELRLEDRALEPESEWKVPRGTLAVTGTTEPRLVLLPGTTPHRDGLRLADAAVEHVVLSVRGRLLGLMASRSPLTFFVTGSLTTTSTEVELPVLSPLIVKHAEWPRAPLPPLHVKVFQEKATPATNLDYSMSPRGGAADAPAYSPTTLIPGAVIARALADVARGGRIRSSYLGVVPASRPGGGAKLLSVVADSPAWRAGLRKGQVVLALNGTRVPDAGTFSRVLVLHGPGETVTLTVEGLPSPVEVVLGDRSAGQKRLVTPESLGFYGVDVRGQLAAYLRLEESAGVAVRRVESGGTAFGAGLRRGDVIVEGNGQPTRDGEELLAVLAGAKKRIALKVLRDGVLRQLLVPLPSPGPRTPR